MKKSLKLAVAAFVAALSLCVFKPVRVWASQEGSYLYHQFFLSGPAVFYTASTAYTGSDGVSRTGLRITTAAYSADSAVAQHFLGAQASKPATTVEGDQYWDTVQHTIAIATCTAANNGCWLKANTATTGAAWTIY